MDTLASELPSFVSEMRFNGLLPGVPVSFEYRDRPIYSARNIKDGVAYLLALTVA